MLFVDARVLRQNTAQPAHNGKVFSSTVAAELLQVCGLVWSRARLRFVFVNAVDVVSMSCVSQEAVTLLKNHSVNNNVFSIDSAASVASDLDYVALLARLGCLNVVDLG